MKFDIFQIRRINNEKNEKCKKKEEERIGSSLLYIFIVECVKINVRIS